MNTKSNKTLSILMLLGGSLLVGFSIGRWQAPLAAWIGPVLIIRYARNYKGWRGYTLVLVACMLAWFIGFGASLASQFGTELLLSLIPIYGLLWSLPYLADRLMSPRLNGFSATFIFPLAAASVEIVNNYTNPFGAWGATGFTQYGNLPLMQLASITGVIGISFLMAWFASVANWVWENWGRGTEIRTGLTAFGAVVAVVFAFGYLRLNLSPFSESTETVRVAGIIAESQDAFYARAEAANLDPTAPDMTVARQLVDSHWEFYFDETTREARAGAKVIVWPEVSAWVLTSDEASLTARAQEAARQNGAYLAIPLATVSLETMGYVENKLLLIDPNGEILFEHVKYGGKIMEPINVGERKVHSLSTPFGVISGVICWDMDYPSVLQQAGLNGTGLMLAPSNDWLEIDPIHTNMAVFRAIENGMSLLRQVDHGLSIAVDPFGRVLAQTDYYSSNDRTVVAQVPVEHVATVYTMFGRWLEWLAPIGFLSFITQALIARRQQK